MGKVGDLTARVLRAVGPVKQSHLRKGSTPSIFSHAYSSGMLPALGSNQSSKDLISKKYVIHPYNKKYMYWQGILIILVFYSSWVAPFEFGFVHNPRGALLAVDNVVNFFFLIDIVLTFFVAYRDNSTFLMECSLRRISFRYLRTWFILDVLSTVPLAAVVAIFTGKYYTGFASSLVNLLRLWRLRRVSALFARVEKNVKFSYFWTRCFKLFLVTVFVCHFAACSFYLLAARHPKSKEDETWLGAMLPNFEEESLWARYVTSVYWSMTTLTTLGYGDLHPINRSEMIFASIYMLLNLALTSYIIGNMTNLITRLTSRTRHYRDSVQHLVEFSTRNGLPPKLHEKIISHLQVKFKTENLRHQAIIATLPKAIRSSVAQFLFFDTVEQVYLFQGTSYNFRAQLVSEMKVEFFPPGEEIILVDEAPSEFYIVVNGSANVFIRGDQGGPEQLLTTVYATDVIGEIGVICYMPQPFTIRSQKLSQLLRLDRIVFMNIVQQYKEDGQRIVDNLLQRLREANDPRFEELSSEIETLLAEDSEMSEPSLCAVAAGGNVGFLQQLLSKGAEVDKPDYHGRTALVIAASKGYEECVKLLLEHGADPNKADAHGKVPLLEALIARDTSTVKVLTENGATLGNADMGIYLGQAVLDSNKDLIDDYLKHGADINTVSESEGHAVGQTALHVAVIDGNMDMVKFLVSRGADAHFKPGDEATLSACKLAEICPNHPEMVSFLKAQPIRLESYSSTTPKDSTSNATQKKLSMKGSSTVEFQVDETSLPGPSGGAPGERTIHSLMRKQSARGRLMTMRSQKALDRKRSEIQNRKQNLQGSGIQRLEKRNTFSTNSSAGAAKVVRLRVILHPYHPRKTGVTGVGKVILLPKSIEALLKIAIEKFNNRPTKVLSKEGAEINDIGAIRDDDHLYVIDDSEDVGSAPQGIDTDDLRARLQAVVTALSQDKHRIQKDDQE
ncbi:potassium channel AKT1 isoform X1 [Physcomitrium patens]|uniref:Uncharacterized protein n=1 Tax=Physcomitrium patens TaxID=3218 RepID=A0A2K1L3E5_PHYPA|nr:potassium channel AKT1-like isoform X1 [Physcomitrium patens]XP_024403151.1 potassium channel AKT1-like isoform X2 [Physcomitrium patens]PNR60552.1 hypothetical protein PHYPA_003345 [Physcomitrium patens]|eukprot:XP_024403142.1 potassium channel AKT1-like isoform X1 [Physcomitrella patens]